MSRKLKRVRPPELAGPHNTKIRTTTARNLTTYHIAQSITRQKTYKKSAEV
jgi:hypothetical protein